jgi:hypothetical protein
MRPHDEPHGLCSIDPISAVLGGIIPALIGGGGDKSTTTSAPAPAPSTPPPQQQPVGSKMQTKSQAPTFLGASATPQPTQSSQKTLLGQ